MPFLGFAGASFDDSPYSTKDVSLDDADISLLPRRTSRLVLVAGKLTIRISSRYICTRDRMVLFIVGCLIGAISSVASSVSPNHREVVGRKTRPCGAIALSSAIGKTSSDVCSSSDCRNLLNLAATWETKSAGDSLILAAKSEMTSVEISFDLAASCAMASAGFCLEKATIPPQAAMRFRSASSLKWRRASPADCAACTALDVASAAPCSIACCTAPAAPAA